MLATDKCYDAVRGPTGETVQKRTTYEKLATEAQAPTEPCNVHGEPRARLARALPAAEFPRASSAVDLNEVAPVIIKTPALLAEKDPYNSAKPNEQALVEPRRTPAEQTAEPPIEAAAVSPAPSQLEEPDTIPKAIPKAIPVEPAEGEESQEPVEIRKAVPLGPLDEIKDPTLLQQAATPPPDDPDGQ